MAKKNRPRGLVSPCVFTKTAPFVFITLLCILIFKAGVVFSHEFESPVDRRDKIFAVHFTDKNTGWVVGDEGLMLHTTDEGKSWIRDKGITEKALYDITFFDNSGWIVGQEGTIIHSGDDGRTWERQESNTEVSLMSVFFVNKKRGIVTGEGGVILQTDNGGESWEECPLDMTKILPDSLVNRGMISPNFYNIFFVGSTQGWIVGDNGIVLFTSDGGRQWEVLRIGLFSPLFSVFFKNDLEGFASGQNGLLLRTTDGGKNWERLALPTGESLYKVCVDKDFMVVVGDNGTLLTSKNGGKRWERERPRFYRSPPWFVDANILSCGSSERLVVCVGENAIQRVLIK